MAVSSHESKKVNVVFRTDASIEIGTGHVMRCLTLAKALKQQGASCHFICREHPGNLIELIKNQGHAVTALPVATDIAATGDSGLTHAHWLGSTQDADAKQTIAAMGRHSRAGGSPQADWLVVDHYALDARWEQELKSHCCQLMVIDDLADREHLCNLLLDQTFGRGESDYAALLPADCKLLCGARYALLRPEFAQWRTYSLERRKQPVLRNILVNLGGVDKDNITGDILAALSRTALPNGCRTTVVMGSTAPWLEQVRQQAQTMVHPVSVLTGVGNMAELMANSDLAIGAAGATSWERCCLGLPTVMVVLAQNQQKVARELEAAAAVILLAPIENIQSVLPGLLQEVLKDGAALRSLSASAARITDGLGMQAILGYLEQFDGEL